MMKPISNLALLPADRFFGPDQHQSRIARQLYETVSFLPLVCPHGHVDPQVFANPDYSFGSPTDLLIIPDHYVYRMLYSQGIPLEDLGVPEKLGGSSLVESDHRKIWQVVAEHFYLFRATPTGQWITHELHDIFGVEERLTGESAQGIYDRVADQLARSEFRPRALFERFNIEVLCTTDAATETLESHVSIKSSGWKGTVRPTFRPDAVLNIDNPLWSEDIAQLGAACGIDIDGYPALVRAIEDRRAFFKRMGAAATDHSARTAYTAELSPTEAKGIVQQALKGKTSADDAARFAGHMLMEMARMSIEDGLVMQLHTGSMRNHNDFVYQRFGPDTGADIPIAGEFTRNLRPLLNKYGNDPRLTLIVFTLDEASYGRELAPIAGHYPAVKLGPPWWFFDSASGMSRYFDEVVEIAGLYNTVGFNDDTRAFCSIPARHDMWRRVSANWLAEQVVRQIVGLDDAMDMIRDMAYGLAKRAYGL